MLRAVVLNAPIVIGQTIQGRSTSAHTLGGQLLLARFVHGDTRQLSVLSSIEL
jgi:hypothetical protein